MLVVHVLDIKVPTKEATDSAVAGKNKRPLVKHLGKVSGYMDSEYKRDREKRESWRRVLAQFVRDVVERFGITNTSPIPASPSLDSRYV